VGWCGRVMRRCRVGKDRVVKPFHLVKTRQGTAARQLPSSRHRHAAVNNPVRMAGGQCPLKGGALTTTAAMGSWSIN
jgi:hypothetical protein